MRGVTVKIRHFLFIVVLLCVGSFSVRSTEAGEFVELSAETLIDKIREVCSGKFWAILTGWSTK